ncbi:U3 small nucleolar RNA-interacting protein 2-like isoform X2 [Pomacea canaliculata]|uniref:U3 small nucleolar RNA-interacting protein 2-like isoform X2 n=1 Tax=Pomacea canaliculata TaxID=400727 RepID=UPI000D7367C7|nr:U3 small nucleolar RNA-interacting protein 2-like isoform X2 [Pomacea canaliculata]
MPFFIRNKGRGSDRNDTKKFGKRPKDKSNDKISNFKRKRSHLDEEIESESEEEREVIERRGKPDFDDSEDEKERETATDKKIRLTKQYLAALKNEEAERGDADVELHEVVSERLQHDALEQAGRLHKIVSDKFLPPDLSRIKVMRGHQLSLTCAVVSPDGRSAFSASKDGTIIKWCLETYKKVHVIPGGRKGTENKHVGHTSCILAMAITSDSKFLATGDANSLIHIWDPSSCQLLNTFEGHRKAISGLAFRKNSHQLFSAGHDRMVKIWNLDEMAYVETLLGHEDKITAIDSLTRERAVTCGGRDRSVRIWKVLEESQLVFHGHMNSIDCVSLINETNFVTGGEDNCICLWSVMKKRPLFTYKNAHNSSGEGSGQTVEENWVTAVASLQYTDLIASGSKDGNIRLWKCSADFRSLTPLFSIPLVGFVNSLQFSPEGDFLLVSVGQEHRLGRWWRIKQAKNALYLIPLPRKDKDS